ncbi:MAG: S-methyl thiohydantoin desulfurase domain-containing protein [Candidatus Heimdallarchaeaceae archaeon]
MTIRELSKLDAYNLVTGAKILACGGGGSEAKALETINKIYDIGMNFTIADLTDFQPDDSLCIVGMVGGGITEEDKKLVEEKKIVEKKSYD